MKNQQLAPSVGSLERYVHTVSQVPVLSLEEELALAERLRKHDDLEAARRLVLSHLRFVVYVARGYSGYGLAQADLIQEGNVGLMKAVKRFDPSREVRLVSFAVHWIRAEIHEFILRNWRIVKVATTKAQRKLFFNLRSSKKRLGWMNQEEVRTVADALGVKPEEVAEMERRLSVSDAAFDGRDGDAQDTGRHAPALYLQDRRQPDPGRALEAAETSAVRRDALASALASLDERSRDIVRRRWLQDGGKSTLQELAEQYQVSAERIRQIESAAMARLRGHMATA